jgi:F420-non-reducing hydrogenase small subunit
LANFTTKDDLFERVYLKTESTANTDHVMPQTHYEVEEGVLELPEFYNDVRALADVVNVDYFIPGCPPQTARLVEVFSAIVTGAELPPPGSVIGAGTKAQCEECIRKKSDKKAIKKLHRPWEVEDDGETCFLEQGILCMGPTTRSGCDYRCIKGNAPCRGCYGPTPDVTDPGTKMMSALASMIDERSPVAIEAVLEDMVDPAGYFYRYSLPTSYIRRRIS